MELTKVSVESENHPDLKKQGIRNNLCKSVTDAERCMKYGFCMSACPVYDIDHVESHVARGRNILIRKAGENGLVDNDSYRRSLDFCMLCGRCEAVCPAGLSPADITLNARNRLYENNGKSFLKKVVNKCLIGKRSVLVKGIGLAAMFQSTTAGKGKPLRHLADSISILSNGVSLPSLSSPFLSTMAERETAPFENTEKQGEIGFFPGCSFEFFQAGVGKDIINSLAKSGYEVIYPKGLSCCGQATRTSGDFKTTALMARQNIDVLSRYDKIVTGCATCGSALKNYKTWFDNDKTMKAKAEEFSEKVFDLSELLVDQKSFDNGYSDYNANSAGNRPVKITYHDPCHLKLHQGIFSQPREILNSINGIDYIEMDHADACCGMGGSFGIINRELSLAIQTKKIEAIKETGADAVVTSCPGCMINLKDGMKRHSLDVNVMHISRFLL